MTDRARHGGGSVGDPAAGDQQPAVRDARRRPVLVELAGALLIVTGALSLVLSIDVLMRLAGQGAQIGLLTLITIVLAIATLGLGLAVRYAYGWLVTVNVAAVLGFLELTSGSPVGLLFGSLDVIVVLALVRERPWFEWEAARRAEMADEARRPGRVGGRGPR